MGLITGDKSYKQRFGEKAAYLRGAGYDVWNPAELPDGMEYEWYMEQCLAHLDTVDAIYCLDNWAYSPGAKREYMKALTLGLEILPVKQTMYICDPVRATHCDKAKCYLRVWNKERTCAVTPFLKQARLMRGGIPIEATPELVDQYMNFQTV